MENDMSKTHEYFQQELGLDQKTSEAIKILMDEGLLGPLLVEMRDAILGKKGEMTPIETSLVRQDLSLEEAREWLSET
jgi:hypothetical protein